MSTIDSARREELHVRQLTSSATDDEVQAILNLSTRVFVGAPANPDTHTSFAYWRGQLAVPQANICVASRSAEPDRPLGFFFNFPRVQEVLGVESMHIWLAGVDEEARGMGVFPMLLERTVIHARELGYSHLTVATLPERFTKMYRILRANGWEEVSRSESDYGRRVLMRLKL